MALLLWEREYCRNRQELGYFDWRNELQSSDSFLQAKRPRDPAQCICAALFQEPIQIAQSVCCYPTPDSKLGAELEQLQVPDYYTWCQSSATATTTLEGPGSR